MKRGGGEVVLEGWQLNFSPILTAGKHIPLHGLWQRTPCFLRSKTAAFSGFHLPPGRGQPGPQRAGGRPPLPPRGESRGAPGSRPSLGASQQTGEERLQSAPGTPSSLHPLLSRSRVGLGPPHGGTGPALRPGPPGPGPVLPTAHLRLQLGGQGNEANALSSPWQHAGGRGEVSEGGEALEGERQRGSRLWRKRPQDTGL